MTREKVWKTRKSGMTLSEALAEQVAKLMEAHDVRGLSPLPKVMPKPLPKPYDLGSPELSLAFFHLREHDALTVPGKCARCRILADIYREAGLK